MKVGNGQIIPRDLPEFSAAGRAQAEHESQDCRYCGGGGLVVVDAREEDTRVKTCSATCVCLMGRWIRAWYQEHGPKMLARIPALGPILEGRNPHWEYRDESFDPDAPPLSRQRHENE